MSPPHSHSPIKTESATPTGTASTLQMPTEMLTVDNLAKRDSLLMLDEEAKQSLQAQVREQHEHEQKEEEIMQAARLKQVNLEIEDTTQPSTATEESKSQKAEESFSVDK